MLEQGREGGSTAPSLCSSFPCALKVSENPGRTLVLMIPHFLLGCKPPGGNLKGTSMLVPYNTLLSSGCHPHRETLALSSLPLPASLFSRPFPSGADFLYLPGICFVFVSFRILSFVSHQCAQPSLSPGFWRCPPCLFPAFTVTILSLYTIILFSQVDFFSEWGSGHVFLFARW